LWTLTDLSVPKVGMTDFDVPAFGAGTSKDQPAMTASPQSDHARSSSIPIDSSSMTASLRIGQGERRADEALSRAK